MARVARRPPELVTDDDANVGEPAPIVSLSPPKRRRPSWVLFGVVLVALSALLGAYVFTATSDRLSVIVAARDLAQGEPISADDLRVIEISRTDQLRAIQPSQQDLVVGLAPRGPIPAGTVLNVDLFALRDEVIPSGQVVVGAALDAGAAPTAALAPGDRVRIVAVALATGGAPAASNVGDPSTPPEATVLTEGTIWAIEGVASAESTARVWVSMLVPEAELTAVAQAAADQRLRLSLLGSG